MRMDGTLLRYNTKSVKARSGSISTQLLSVNSDTGIMKVGDAKFPMLPTGIFTPEPDGITAQHNDRLVIALGNQWWTPNVVTVVSNITPSEGQLASYTVQHGSSSRILTNTADQETQILHIENEPVRIVASNFSTGAIGRLDLNPVAGQGYVISSNSVTTVEGELKTIGEITTVCTRQELNYNTAPKLTAQFNVTKNGARAVIGPFTSSGGVSSQFSDVYTKLKVGDPHSPPSGITFTKDYYSAVQVISRYVNSKVYLRLISAANLNADNTVIPAESFEEAINARPAINEQAVQFIQTGGIYRIFTDTGTTTGDTDNYAREDWKIVTTDGTSSTETMVELELIGKRFYQFNLLNQLTGEFVKKIGPYFKEPPSSGWYGDLEINFNVAHQLFVLGPMQYECVQTEVIDTRQVVDTRRNVYTITVYASPLN